MVLQQSDDILRLLPPELATLGITELEYEFYRRLVEKQSLTYRLHGESWREAIERPVVHKDYDEQPRGPFIVCVEYNFPAQWAALMNSVRKRSAWP